MHRAFVVLLDLIFLLRPMVLVPVWTILLVAYITAWPCPLFQKTVPLVFVGALLLFTTTVGAIYVVNQIVDQESDALNNKLFIIPQKHISVKQAGAFAIVLVMISLLGSFFLSRGLFLFISISLLLGGLYNFEPFNLRSRPIGGLVANFLGHGILTYLVGWYMVVARTTSIDFSNALFYALFSGFANGAVYLLSTIADEKGDKMVGKHTFAVVYGAQNTRIVAALFVTLSLIFSLFLPYNRWFFVIPTLVSTLLFWYAVYHKTNNVHHVYTLPVLLLGFVVALFVPIYGGAVLVVVVSSRIYYQHRFHYRYPSL